MYISSLMVVVIALDRVFSILSPMSANQQRKRTKILLISAWTLSLLCAIPALFLFSLIKKQFCPDQPIFHQCVDFSPNINKQDLKPYYFFTMCVSFLIPLFFTVISYSLILCEINAMQRRDERITGRRDNNIERARMKTLVLTSLVTLSFIVLWGPYYAMGIYHWFNPRERATFPKEISVGLFVLMYFHPAVHPILYGFFMKDIRKHFLVTLMRCFKLSSVRGTDADLPPKRSRQRPSTDIQNQTCLTNIEASRSSEEKSDQSNTLLENSATTSFSVKNTSIPPSL